MPTLMHEGLIEMVRKRPAVVADFLTGVLGVKVPPFEKAQLSPNDLTEVTPTEFRADQVVALRKANDDAAFAVVVEVQLRVDERRRRTWPVYFATVHHRLKCPVALLVLCPSEAMAEWSADPIRIGDPGMVLNPIALGPKQVPVVTDLQTAREHPELGRCCRRWRTATAPTRRPFSAPSPQHSTSSILKTRSYTLAWS